MSDKLMGAAAVIVNDEGKVLLVKHSYGRNNWDLPGGKSESDESAEGTAAREVLEEIGVQVEIGALTGVYYDSEYDMHHFVFLATIRDDQQPKPSSDEIEELGYYALNDLPRPMKTFTYNRIQDALNPIQEPLFHTTISRQWLE